MANIFEPPRCDLSNSTVTPASDAGVAGAGVLISFIATAAFSLVISVSIILQEFKGKQSLIRRKLLNSYSDQQILTGIGIQAVGLARRNFMIPYHFFIIWTLSLLSMAVHNATLITLAGDFRRDWVLRWMRQFLMFVNLVLSCVYGVFILQAVRMNLTERTLPIACVWEVTGEGTNANLGLSFVGTILVIAGNCIVFTLASWYLHARIHKWAKFVKLFGVFLMGAIAIGAAVRVIIASEAFGNGPSFELRDGGEKEWGFGQLLSILVLLFPVVSTIEILRGDLKVAPPMLDDGKVSLNDTEMQGGNRASFQPNPFWGSRTNLFKK